MTDSIEAQQADIQRRMDENVASGGSEEEFQTLLAQDEQLTAARAGARGLAHTPQAKSVAARIKDTRVRLAELEAKPAGETRQESFHRMQGVQEATRALENLERQAPFAGRDDDSIAAEREEALIAIEEAKESLSSLPQGSARRRREDARLAAALDRSVKAATELDRRRQAAGWARAREETIARKALQEAKVEYRSAQGKAAAEELRKLERTGNVPWYELEAAKAKAREAHLLQAPAELIEKKAKEIATRPELSWLSGA